MDLDEGQLEENFEGRRWEVVVQTASESREAAVEAGDNKKAEKQKQKDKADDTALLVALDRLDPQGRKGASITDPADPEPAPPTPGSMTDFAGGG